MSDPSAEREVADETMLEDRAAVPELAALREGAPERIGRYRLLAKLGAGGFATVYLARLEGAAGFGRFVAIKRIHDHLASEPELVAMFLDEARVASAIDHANVCAPLDFGRTEDGTYFLGMDYLLGEPLSEVRRAYGRVHGAPKPEDVAFVLRVLADAAHGLHAAHEALDARGRPLEIVHRDVAPANLFVLFTGHVKVVDFGIAKAARKLHTTQHGVFKGHVPFASPEHLRGHALDRRADLWSLGVVLWEMLAKRRLFPQKDEVALVDAIVRDPIPALREKAPWVSPRLATLVHRCLSREVDARPASALELALGLEEELRRLRVPMGVHEVGAYMHALLPERARARYRQLWALAEEAGFATSLVTSLELDSSEISEQRLAPVAGAAADDESDPDATVPLPAADFSMPPPVVVAASRSSAPPPAPPPRQDEPFSDETVVDDTPPSTAPATPVLPVGLDLSLFDAQTTADVPPAERPSRRPFVWILLALVLGGSAFAVGRLSAPTPMPVAAPTPPRPPLAPPPAPVAPTANPVVEMPVEPSVAEESQTPRRSTRRVSRVVARPAGRGTVAVTATGGWGEVFVGTHRLGVTPGRFELPAGPTTLRVVPASGRAQTVRVVVPVDDVARVRVELE
ncbi:MAG: serine/threonine protein kinase [Sandaracinus sp.]|nr:serine/threonine protein kinase [Sandaracinus sp.]MCB9621775.1 serine/threonine protein kinase [Sandaracinus sp.]MCB9632272.1 serine/threonine protein kinase [Sandaracinus sp.]